MKKILTSIGILLIPFFAFAISAPVDRLNNNHIEPLIKTDFFQARYLKATSTTDTSYFAGKVGIGTSSPYTTFAVDTGTSTFSVINPLRYANTVMAFEGDSLTFGYFPAGVSCPDVSCSYPSYLTGISTTSKPVTNFVPGNGKYGTMYYQNFGVLGQEAPTAIANYTTKAHLMAPTGQNQLGYYFVMFGTNDINNGSSASTVWTNLQTLYALARADGYKVVAFTVSPLLGSRDVAPVISGSELHPDQRRALNDLIRADHNVHYDYLVETDKVMPDSTDARYFTAVDQIHFTPAGQKLLAQHVSDTLDGQTWSRRAHDTTASSTNAGFDAIFTGNNVGIGTSTPNEKLSVYGNISLNMTNGGWLNFLQNNSGNPDGYIQHTFGDMFTCEGAFFNGGTFTYAPLSASGNQNGTCIQQEAGSGVTYFIQFPSGTPGAAATPSYGANISGNGYLNIQGSSVGAGSLAYATYPLQVTGQGKFSGLVDADHFVATSTTATSTGGNGWNITGGCYAKNNTCIVGSGASSTLLSDSNTFSGVNTFSGQTNLNNNVSFASGVDFQSNTVSNVGTLTFSGLKQGWLHTANDGTGVTSSTSPTVNYLYATSTTATSTFMGSVSIASSTSWGSRLSIEVPATTTYPAMVVGHIGSTTPFFTIVGMAEQVGGAVGIGTSTPNVFSASTNSYTPLSRLTVSNGSIFQNITDSTGLRLDSTITGFTTNWNVRIANNYAYDISSGNNRLGIVDVSTSTSPILVGSVTDATRLAAATDQFLSGKYDYVVGSNFLSVVDISNPSSPSIVGYLSDTRLGGIQSLYVTGKYAFTAAQSQNNMSIIDISNPIAPKFLSQVVDGTNLAGANDVFVQGNYAYIAPFNATAISVVDVSNPMAPFVAGTISDATNLNKPQALYVRGKYAYVAVFTGKRITVVDVSNPTSMSVVGSLNDATRLNGPVDIQVIGDYALVAAQSNNTVTLVNVKDVSKPQIVGTIAAAVIRSLTVAGRHLYTANQTAGSLVIDEFPGIDIPSADIGSLKASILHLEANADIGNNMVVHGGLSVGQGILADGSARFGTSATTSLMGLPTGTFSLSDVNTSSVVDVLSLLHTGTSTLTVANGSITAAGIGTGLLYQNQDDSGNATDTLRIAGILTNVASTSLQSEARFYLNATTTKGLKEVMRMATTSLSIASTTVNSGVLNLGTTNGLNNGSSTIATGKFQFDSYDDDGTTRRCVFIHAGALTFAAGACKP